jgi:hypothetical protein
MIITAIILAATISATPRPNYALPSIKWTSPTDADIYLCPEGYYPIIITGLVSPTPYLTAPTRVWHLHCEKEKEPTK